MKVTKIVRPRTITHQRLPVLPVPDTLSTPILLVLLLHLRCPSSSSSLPRRGGCASRHSLVVEVAKVSTIDSFKLY